MNVGSAGAMMTVERTLLVQLNPTLTDSAVRQLRAVVGMALESQSPRGLVLDPYQCRCHGWLASRGASVTC